MLSDPSTYEYMLFKLLTKYLHTRNSQDYKLRIVFAKFGQLNLTELPAVLAG
jgi:hypothetical protein